MIREYPDKFVAKSKKTDYVWDVTKLEDQELWSWKVRGGDGVIIGPYTTKFMDAQDCEFIFPEPELVFPFTVKHKLSGNVYVITQGSVDEMVTLVGDSLYPNHISKIHCKENIKGGVWIVQSVGDTKPKVLDTLKVKINTTKALANIKELTEAVDTLTDAFANLNAVMGKYKNV